MVNSSAVGRPRCVDRAAREKEAGFMPSYCWTFDTNMSEGEVDKRTHSVAPGLALMRVEGFVIGAIGECPAGRPLFAGRDGAISGAISWHYFIGGRKDPPLFAGSHATATAPDLSIQR